ncbi:right-handed parallel beta-helix repeat-containing protein, partial [bacterium]|nr:right-handed parallel beta-helix repeat-containing protein [bacterium]
MLGSARNHALPCGWSGKKGQLWIAACLAVLCLILASGIYAQPLLEAFEGSFPPDGWYSFRQGLGDQGWQFSLLYEGDDWNASAFSPPEASAPIQSSYHWLLTPPLYPAPGQYSFSFYARTQFPAHAGTDTLFVLIAESGAAPESFTDTLLALRTGLAGEISTSFQRFALDLSSFDRTTIFVAFVHAVRGPDDNAVYLDSVSGPGLSAHPIPPFAPIPSDSASGVNVDAVLSWSNPFNPDVVDVYFSRDLADVENRDPSALVAFDLTASQFDPPSNFLSNTTYYWRVVARNTVGEAPGPVWRFTAGTGPLAGSYRIGGEDAEFASLSSAIAALVATGVAGPTTLRIAGGILAGPIVFPAIPGASLTSPVTFTRADTASTVTVTCSSPTDTAAVVFDNAAYLTLDGLNVVAGGGAVRHAVVIQRGSHHNTIRGGEIRGRGATVANSSCVCVYGAGTNDNILEDLPVRGAISGIRLECPAGESAHGNTVRDCTFDSVRYGVRIVRQANCHVTGNDIDPNAGSFDEVDGIWVGTTMPGDTVHIHGNQIDKVTTAGVYAVGIRVKTDSSAAVVRIYNNFLFDFRSTGSAQTRAIFISSGNVDVVSNSILIGDVTSSGATYGIYLGALNTQGRLTLLNNIFANFEATNAAYNVFSLSTAAILTSDYNIFHGSGSGYRVGRWGADQLTLASWQQATSGDSHSLTGNPFFMSATDLHLDGSSDLAHQNGAVVFYVMGDIDGEPRLLPPDRGADEYRYAAPPADLAVTGFIGLRDTYAEMADHVIEVIVQNRGSDPQVGVPVRLSFDGDLQDETTVSLAALASDTVSLIWFARHSPDTGVLKAQCHLAGDAKPDNDSLTAEAIIVPTPLSGDYTIGGANPDFVDFAAAVSALQLRGVSGPVNFQIAGGTYNGQVTLPAVPGASSVNRIVFRPDGTSGTVEIASNQAPASLVLSGARHVVAEGILVRAVSPNVVGVLVTQGSDSNEITGCTLIGSALEATTACGVRMTGGGNDDNRFTELSVSGFYHGIRGEGTASGPDVGTVVENCRITGSRIAVRMAYQHRAVLQSNELHPGYASASGTCYGLYLGATGVSETILADGNAIFGGVGGAGCGIYSATAGGTAVLRNNMIGAWNTTNADPTYGILIGGGAAEVQFNSLWMNDVPGSGWVVGIADTGTASVNAINNVIQISESENPAWCILHSGGSFVSDYNAFHLSATHNIQLRIGRWFNINLPALPDWQAATGHDPHSLTGDPGFVDSLNLHIRMQAGLLDGRGIAIAGADRDFDGETRTDPPDIGADEYEYRLVECDFGVSWAGSPPGKYSAHTSYPIPVRIVNNGILPQSSGQIRLSFDGITVNEAMVSLSSGEADTVVLNWATPSVALRQGTLIVRCYLEDDAVPQNDSVAASVLVVGLPLYGGYVVGTDSHSIHAQEFSDLTEAVTHLMLRGVEGTVTLELTGGIHDGPLVLGEIPGASSIRPVVFRSLNPYTQPAEITAGTGDAVVRLNGTDYVTFENLRLRAAASCTTVVSLADGACFNKFSDCELIGSDSASSVTMGVRILTDENDWNTFDAVSVRGAFYGIAFKGGPSGSIGQGNSVRSCRIQHARYGIYVGKQANCDIAGNDIQPGSLSNVVAACYGIYVTNLGDAGCVTIRENTIHDFADASGSVSNRAVGIFAAPTTGSTALIYNNFIYGFQTVGSLRVSPLYLSSGNVIVLHNSVLIENLPFGGDVTAVYISTGTGHVLKNNILVSQVQGRPSYGVFQVGGTGLSSNGNDLFGTSSQFVVGNICGTPYATFANWQAAGYDSSGISADPGFRGP